MKIEMREFLMTKLGIGLKNIYSMEGQNVEQVEHKLSLSGFTKTGTFDCKIPGREGKISVWVRMNSDSLCMADVPLVATPGSPIILDF